jgi:hypothetical protein
MLTRAQQRELVHLLDAVRAGHRRETATSALTAASQPSSP